MIRVGIFRDGSAPVPAGQSQTSPSRGLIRVAVQEVPDNSNAVEADAWRLYTRTNALPDGQYVVQRLGRRYKMEETRSSKSTDLGAEA